MRESNKNWDRFQRLHCALEPRPVKQWVNDTLPQLGLAKSTTPLIRCQSRSVLGFCGYKFLCVSFAISFSFCFVLFFFLYHFYTLYEHKK